MKKTGIETRNTTKPRLELSETKRHDKTFAAR